MPTPERTAWAAGLYEGEGCATLKSTQNNHPSVHLSSTDRDVVETFAEIVEVGNIYISNRRNGLSKKTQYIWQTAKSEDVVHVLTLLLPYLHTRRKERAEEVLAIARIRADRLGNRRENLVLLKKAGLVNE